MKLTKRIQKEHDQYHYQTSNFDYWCVAPRHPAGGYFPKYLEPYGCHSDDTDDMCSEECRICMRYNTACPVENCNKYEYWDEDNETWLKEGEAKWEVEKETHIT